MSLAQCTEDVANSCWAWNCNARHGCAKRRAPRCGIGCANATAPCAAPPHTVRRHGPHLGALLHKIRREEGRTGSPKTARAPLPLGGEGAGGCRAICERYRHGCHCTRLRAAPCRRQRPQPYEVETHSRSHSLLQSRASATVRPCAGGGDGVRNSSSGGCICEFAKCIERDRRRRAAALVSLPTRCAIVAAAIAACTNAASL